MSSLTFVEKKVLENLLEMGGGTLLDFSNNSLQDFFETTLGIDIYSEKYNHASSSKANRMRSFWDTEDDIAVARVLNEMVDLIELDEDHDKSKIGNAKSIIERLNGGKKIIVAEHNNEDLEDIWEPDKLRIFISHRDKHKKKAMELGEKLKVLGTTSFVAHESITPTTKWKDEIQKGLETMDACIPPHSQELGSSRKSWPHGRLRRSCSSRW